MTSMKLTGDDGRVYQIDLDCDRLYGNGAVYTGRFLNGNGERRLQCFKGGSQEAVIADMKKYLRGGKKENPPAAPLPESFQ